MDTGQLYNSICTRTAEQFSIGSCTIQYMQLYNSAWAFEQFNMGSSTIYDVQLQNSQCAVVRSTIQFVQLCYTMTIHHHDDQPPWRPTIMPTNHHDDQPSLWPTIMTTNHHDYKLSWWPAIMMINHCWIWQSTAVTRWTSSLSNVYNYCITNPGWRADSFSGPKIMRGKMFL